MKHSATKLIFALIFICRGLLYAQDNPHTNAFFNDAQGRPIKLKQEFNIEGSPYYYDDYCAADIYLANGKKYTNVKTKLNLAENQVLFMDSIGNEMETIFPVKKIHFYRYFYHPGTANEEAILTTFNQAMNIKGNEIAELLVDSTVKLVKKIYINYTDIKRYNEATITRTYSRNEVLFAYLPSKEHDLIKIQKNKSAIIELLNDKSDKIIEFIKNNRLKCKTEKEIIQVFEYYNSL